MRLRGEKVLNALRASGLRSPLAEPLVRPQALRTLAFFEAYFSNYIEGTRGTYRVVSNLSELRKLPQDAERLWTLLSTRHEAILDARPETRPGEIKAEINRAGETVFVAPDLVRGTLAKGFEFYKVLDSPSARAAFMMFLISEVHPFIDGNGRIARVMMNAELVAAGLRRIVIPRALSRRGDPAAYLRMIDRAERFSASIDFSDFASARRALEAANAFKDPGEARLLDA